MDMLQDVGILFIAGVVLYALFGDAVAKLGLKPLVQAVLQGALAVADVGMGWLKIAVIWVGYGLILGRKDWRGHIGYVEQEEAFDLDPAPLPVSQPIPRTAQLPIATPQTARNEPVVIAPAINGLSSDEQMIVSVLARLIASGELTQTAAIKTGLGISPGSRSPRYLAAREAIQAELLKLAPPAPLPADTPEAWESNGQGSITRIRTAAR